MAPRNDMTSSVNICVTTAAVAALVGAFVVWAAGAIYYLYVDRPKSEPTNQEVGLIMGTKIGGVIYPKGAGMGRPMPGGGLLRGGQVQPNILADALAKQGVSEQQITVPNDVSIPTNNGDGEPIQLSAGQSVMVIKTQKGLYLQLPDGKTVVIRVPEASNS